MRLGFPLHRRVLGLGLAALVVAALGCSAKEEAPKAAPVAPAQGPVARAAVIELSGEVWVKRSDGDDWVSAKQGMSLFENDKLRTAKGASARLSFTAGSTLAVGEDALLGIAESRPMPGQERSDVTVLKGRIDAELTDSAKQSLTVATPAAMVRAGREIVFQ